MIAFFQSLSDEKKAALVFVLATALSSGLGILTTPLFTRMMPIEDYGVLSLYNSWYQLINVFASFSVTNAVINVGFHKYPDDRIGYLSSSLGITIFFTLIISIFLFAFNKWFIKISGLNISLVVLLIMSFLFLTSTNLWLNLQKYKLKYKAVFLITVFSAIFSTIFSLLAVYSAKSNFAEIKLWTANALPLLIGFCFFVYILKKGNKIFNKIYWKFIITFNAPLLIHYLAQYLLSSSDRLMIKFYEGESSVAIYSLAYTVSNILLLLYYPINSVIIPFTHKCIDNNNEHALKKCIYMVLVVSSILLSCISLLAPEIILALGGKKYLDGVYIIPIVSLSTLFVIFYQLVANIEFLFGKTYRIAIMTIIAGIINVLLNILLIPQFGYISAAYTTLIAYALYSWFHLRNMYKQYKPHFFSLKILLLIFIGSIFMCCSPMLIFDKLVLRLIILAIALVLVSIVFHNNVDLNINKSRNNGLS